MECLCTTESNGGKLWGFYGGLERSCRDLGAEERELDQGCEGDKGNKNWWQTKAIGSKKFMIFVGFCLV